MNVVDKLREANISEKEENTDKNLSLGKQAIYNHYIRNTNDIIGWYNWKYCYINIMKLNR